MPDKLLSFAHLAAALSKPGSDIAQSISAREAHLWHMATGVSGEAGEILDIFKKHVVYGKPLDRQHVIEELGDLRFFEAGIMNTLGISEQEILEHINAKLAKRYSSGGYSDADANNRVDKLPQNNLPKVPANVYYRPIDNSFHDMKGNGLGEEFFGLWQPRSEEFPVWVEGIEGVHQRQEDFRRHAIAASKGDEQ